jgi:hypothetical protein
VEITSEEKQMVIKIEINQFTGGAFKYATFMDKVCRNKTDKSMLKTFCEKGLVETGL